MVVQDYIQAKYSAGGPGSERFEPDPTEVHASQLSDCQRKRFWKHERAHDADPSPYFELGRVFELLYGAALAHAHDPAIGEHELKANQPWGVAAMSDRVVQDVSVTIELDAGAITGECDWVVLDPECPAARDPGSYGELDAVTLREGGSREALFASGDGMAYDRSWVRKVVETKTKKDLSYLGTEPDEKHRYQVYPYMRAMDCPGEVAYMQRNDFAERTMPVELDDATWVDCVVRATEHMRNYGSDELPPTTPLDGECRWCPYKQECKREGGSAW
jgi:CRISPR/Cas system-associated exonuclease Cas4 (RecB family)